VSIHNEVEFENEICDHLLAHGWLYAKNDADIYDRQLALFPADVIAWIKQTQPTAWESLSTSHGLVVPHKSGG
jgi:type I restriction enzyme, R subunit